MPLESSSSFAGSADVASVAPLVGAAFGDSPASVDFAFIDSGTGGIPYLLALKEKWPETTCVYAADTKNFPYGQKSHAEIISCAVEFVGKVVEKFNPKVVVVACNTMSVNVLEVLREDFPDTLFVGTVPAIKLAASITKNKRIGLLATKATVENPYNQDLKAHFAADCSLVLRADADLISFIEEKSFSASEDEILKACKPAADFFKNQNCDVVILGCTHFLNIKSQIQAACGDGIKVVDSVDGVVRQALRLCGFSERVLANEESVKKLGSEQFCEAKLANVGALRGAEPPVRRGSGSPKGWNEGKAFPSCRKSSLYLTGGQDFDEAKYRGICGRFGFDFGGLV